MTRVLHVLDHSLPLHSGYSFRTRAILANLQRGGVEVRGVTGLRHYEEGPDREDIDGLVFERTRGSVDGPAGMREWREVGLLAQSVERVAREWGAEVIHAHSPALCGLAALRAARRIGLPLVYEIRAFWEDAAVDNGQTSAGSLRYRLTRAMETHVVSAADAVFTISHALRDDLVSRGLSAGKIGVSPNGVDLALFGEQVRRDEALARELGLGDGPVIGFIGSFYDYEGLDDLVRAMALLRERHPRARALLVGGGPAEEALRKRASALPDNGGIVFTGRVPHDAVPRYYSLVDILAYPRKPSRLTELVTPLKPLEAMAQGRIVAASDVGGHRELIDDGITGALFPAGDAEGCAAALSGLIERSEAWPAMRSAARQRIESHHDWKANVRRYQDVYQHLLARKAKRRLDAAA